MDDFEIPETGAVFTFGKSRFADNKPSHFFIKNDPIIDIACGDEHTAVLCQNGRVFSFGSNEYGQLGLGNNSTAFKPSCVKSLKPAKVVRLACGRSHTLALTDKSKLYSFGNNTDGQLGLGDTEDRNVPTLNENISLDSSENIKHISAGSSHSAILTDKGRIFIWGSNSEGQLGLTLDKDMEDKCLSPRLLEFHEKIQNVSCGYYHTAFVTENGDLYTFGENENGKLGFDSNEKFIKKPHKVNLDVKIESVFCGGNHTCILTVHKYVYVFGSNLNGQLGLEPELKIINTPQKLETRLFGNGKVDSIACGESHSAFVTDTGKLYMCGDARHGKLCQDDENIETESQFELKPVTIFEDFQVLNVSCGGCHTILTAKKAEINSGIPKILPPLERLPMPKIMENTSDTLKNRFAFQKNGDINRFGDTVDLQDKMDTESVKNMSRNDSLVSNNDSEALREFEQLEKAIESSEKFETYSNILEEAETTEMNNLVETMNGINKSIEDIKNEIDKEILEPVHEKFEKVIVNGKNIINNIEKETKVMSNVEFFKKIENVKSAASSKSGKSSLTESLETEELLEGTINGDVTEMKNIKDLKDEDDITTLEPQLTKTENRLSRFFSTFKRKKVSAAEQPNNTPVSNGNAGNTEHKETDSVSIEENDDSTTNAENNKKKSKTCTIL